MPSFPARSLGVPLALALLNGCSSVPPNCGEATIKSDSKSGPTCVWVPGRYVKPDSYVALLENPDGTTGKLVVKGGQGEQVIDKARDGAPLDGSQAAAPVAEEKLQRDFGAAFAARPQLPERFLLYFERGDKLTADSKAQLRKIIENAAQRPGVDISIIGHTDTAGKADANERLALKRAQSIAEQLKAQGLKAFAVSVESHGERNPLIKTPDETPEPRNRRVEVSLR